MAPDWNSVWRVYTASCRGECRRYSTFFSRSIYGSPSDFTDDGGGRSWQMVAIEVTCKVHYGARQVYTALLLKSENVYRLTFSLLVSAPSNIASNVDCPSAQVRKWNSVPRCLSIWSFVRFFAAESKEANRI